MYNYNLMLTAKPAIMSFTESSQQWMCSFCLCKVGHDREEYNIYVRGSGWEVWVRQEAHRKLVMKKARQTKGKKEKRKKAFRQAKCRGQVCLSAPICPPEATQTRLLPQDAASIYTTKHTKVKWFFDLILHSRKDLCGLPLYSLDRGGWLSSRQLMLC